MTGGSNRRRPGVSVIVPFAGTPAALEGVIRMLEELELEAGDEVIVADNRRRPSRPEHPRIRIIDASQRATPAHARNRGATAAGQEWLVFLDADVRPLPGLLGAYFDPLPAPETAVLAGGIHDVAAAPPLAGGSVTAATPSLAARYSVSRGHMAHAATLSRGRFSYAQTANCAVRRRAFESVQGFADEARAGEDADLCFRLAARSWRLERRSDAAVEHAARASLVELSTQLAVHGSGAAWVERRHPGAFPAPGALALARRLSSTGRQALLALVHGESEAAALASTELLATGAFELGRLLPNRRAGARSARSRRRRRGRSKSVR